ncbi:hypothetical protein [Nonomuraea sp. SBT364]|uniref:hypothetical protein n=1 Tax=Nonomuraea sp. SBT364 TaxID=1580530 RepID=UPI00066B05B3|nr:hypothetical protein [Nonomuraea sp. SBT364]
MTTTYPQGDLSTALVDHRSRRRPVAVGAAVFMTLVLLVLVLKIVEGVLFQPANTVRAFFQALNDRDADAAGALVVPDPERDLTGTDLRGGAVLRSPGYTPPTAVEAGPVVPAEDDQATVGVSYSVGGQRQQVMLTLERDERATVAGLFREWRIVKGAIGEAYTQVETAGPVLVAGASASAEYDVLRAYGYPGGYRVTLPEQPLLEAEPVIAYTGADRYAEPGVLRPVVKATVQDEVDKQVRTLLDRCSKGTEITRENCPYPWSNHPGPEQVKIKVVSYPTCEITVSRGQVTARGTGQVRIRQPSFFGVDESTTEFTVSGDVTALDNAVTFQYVPQ